MSNDLETDLFDEMEEGQIAHEEPPTGQWGGVLAKWCLLYPLCAVVLCGAVYLGIWLQGLASPTIRVTLATEPEDVDVWEAGRKLEPAEDGMYHLSPGKHELTFRQEGYKERVEEYVVSAEHHRFEVVLEKLAATSVVVNIVPADAELRVDGVRRATSGGSVELRASGDKPLVLQASHPDYHAFRESYSSAQWASADGPLQIELVPLESVAGLPEGLMAKEGARPRF